MRYLVSGLVTQHVTVEVDADSRADAIDKAFDLPSRSYDVWDTDANFFAAEAME